MQENLPNMSSVQTIPADQAQTMNIKHFKQA